MLLRDGAATIPVLSCPQQPQRQQAGSTHRRWGLTLLALPQLQVQLNPDHMGINFYSDENTDQVPTTRKWAFLEV